MLPNGRVHHSVLLDTRVGDHGDGKIGMIVRYNLNVGRIILHLLRLIGVGKQILQLLGLFLWKVLVQRTDEMVSSFRAVVLRRWIQLLASERHVEVRPECSILLDFFGNLDSGFNLPVLTVVADGKILLLKDQGVLWDRVERGHHNRRRDIDSEVQGTVCRPYRRDGIGNMAVSRDLTPIRSSAKGRDVSSFNCRSRSLLLRSEDLTDDELSQEEDPETLDGGPEAGL